jgi:hypothetical protein
LIRGDLWWEVDYCKTIMVFVLCWKRKLSLVI